MEREKLEVTLPRDLVERMDEILELLCFRSRDDLVEAAVRRLLDRYAALPPAR